MIRIAIAVAVNRGVRRIHCRTGLDVGGRLGRYALGRHVEAPLRCDRIQLHVAGRIKLHVVAIRDIHLARELVVRVGEIDVARPCIAQSIVVSANRDCGVAADFDMVTGYITHSRHLLRKVAVGYLNIEVGSSADFAELKAVVVLYGHALRGIEVDGRAEVILRVVENNVAVNRLEGSLPRSSYILRGYSALGDVTFLGGHAERTLRVNAAKVDGILVDKLDVGTLRGNRLVVLESIADIVERYIAMACVAGIGGGEGRRVLGDYDAGLGDVARAGRKVERTVRRERADDETAGLVNHRNHLASALDGSDGVPLGSEQNILGAVAQNERSRVDNLAVRGCRLLGSAIEGQRGGVDSTLRLGELAADCEVLPGLADHRVSYRVRVLVDSPGDFDGRAVAVERTTRAGLGNVADDLLRVYLAAGGRLGDRERRNAVGARDVDRACAILRQRLAGRVDGGRVYGSGDGRVLGQGELLGIDRTAVLVEGCIDLEVVRNQTDGAARLRKSSRLDFRGVNRGTGGVYVVRARIDLDGRREIAGSERIGAAESDCRALDVRLLPCGSKRFILSKRPVDRNRLGGVANRTTLLSDAHGRQRLGQDKRRRNRDVGLVLDKIALARRRVRVLNCNDVGRRAERAALLGDVALYREGRVGTRSRRRLGHNRTLVGGLLRHVAVDGGDFQDGVGVCGILGEVAREHVYRRLPALEIQRARDFPGRNRSGVLGKSLAGLHGNLAVRRGVCRQINGSPYGGASVYGHVLGVNLALVRSRLGKRSVKSNRTALGGVCIANYAGSALADSRFEEDVLSVGGDNRAGGLVHRTADCEVLSGGGL